MANNFDSNITRPLARVFLEKFETARVLSKNVDTQLLAGRFNPSTGDTVDFKRPTDYRSVRTPSGDVSGETKSDIITGKASGIVQNYFTVFVDYSEADEAIKMDQLDQLLAPMATRIVTDLEVDFAAFMMKNAGLEVGTYGTPVTGWSEVAEAGALMTSTGIPTDAQWSYAMNPYTQTNLAEVQRSLGAGGTAGGLVDSAHRKAVVSDDFAGMMVMSAQALASYTSDGGADRAGTVNGAPDATYLTAKDTMTQSITVADFGTFTGTIPAGTVVSFPATNRLNLSTRQPIIDGTGANVVHTAVLVQDAALVTGAGTLIVSGPAIQETDGQYNTVDVAIANSDVINLLGSDATLYQPNLFWHKQAFAIGSVPIKKLHSTDTVGTTEDGLQIRVSSGAGFLENLQQVRFDFRPAYGVMNPFFAGQAWGNP